jgi:hypothetical protein
MSELLFKLPEYNSAFARFVSTAIQELMRQKDAVLDSIKVVESPQIPTVRNTMPSGEIVENRPMPVAMPFAVDFREAIAGNPDSLLASIDNAAEEGLKIVMPQIFDYMGRLCQAAGTATNAGGQKLRYEQIRLGLEKVQIDFDDNGQPILPTLIMHPDMLEQLRKLPPATEDEVLAWQELIESKRREFYARRRTRKLS